MDIKGILVNALLPLLISAGKDAGVDFLDKFQVENPDWHKTIVIVGYRLATAHLDALVDTTENTFDDKAVDLLVDVLKESGEKYSIVLQ